MQNRFAVIAMIMMVMIGMTGLGAATTVSIGNGDQDVTIPIMVEDVTNLGACTIQMAFDETIATVTDVTVGDMDATIINDATAPIGQILIVAFQDENPGLSGNVKIVDVTFTYVNQCSVDASDLALTVLTLKEATPAGGVITHEIANGEYVAVLCGDVTHDGSVGSDDVMYLAQHLAGISGFESIVCMSATDVDGVPPTDAADCSYLAKHIAGIPGYEDLNC